MINSISITVWLVVVALTLAYFEWFKDRDKTRYRFSLTMIMVLATLRVIAFLLSYVLPPSLANLIILKDPSNTPSVFLLMIITFLIRNLVFVRRRVIST